MKNYVFRLLRAHEIEARPSRINKDNSVNLLLYKTSRVDMQLLDETFGNCGWQVEHKIVYGELWTTLLVRDPETGEVIKKEDVGEWSDNTLRKLKDKENPVPVDELYLVPNGSKARFSDGLKRCGTLMGIGRELYSAPDIYIPANKVTVKYGQCYTKFEIEEIEYDEYKQIVYLKIVDEKTGEPLFVWRRRKKITKEAPAVKPQVAPKETPKEAPKEAPKEEPKEEPKPEAEVKEESDDEPVRYGKTENGKEYKIASKKQIEQLKALLKENDVDYMYLINCYAKKGITNFDTFPASHVEKYLNDFKNTVLMNYCKWVMTETINGYDVTLDDVVKTAGTDDWTEIVKMREKIIDELIPNYLPFN